MTQIKKLKNSQGVQVYPQTHTKAVIDDNGYTAESRLQAMQNEINAKQMELGAVPSDLTPTEGSSNWVTSGGLFNLLYADMSEHFDLNDYSAVKNWINPGDTWSTSWYGKFIPVIAGQTYRITAKSENSSCYAFLTSNVGGAQNASVTTYATGASRHYLEPNTVAIDTAPSDATYMWIGHANNTSESRAPLSVELYSIASLREMVNEVDDEPTEGSGKFAKSGGIFNAIQNSKESTIETILEPYETTTIDISSLTEQNCSLGSISWYMNTSTNAQRHIAIPVVEGEKYIISWTQTASGACIIGWLSSSYSPPYSNNNTIPYATGQTGRILLYESQELTVPSNAAYLAITTVDGSGTVFSFSLSKLIKKGYDILNRIESCESALSIPPVKLHIAHWNIGHFTYYDGAQGTSTPNIPTTLVDIPYTTLLNQGKYNADGTATSSNYYVYTRFIRRSGNISLNEGYVVESLVRCDITENTFTSEEINSSSSAFTVNNGEYIRLNIKKSDGGTISTSEDIISTLTIKKAKNEWMKERYRALINDVNADILCICEDDPVFDAAGTTSLSAIYSCYNTKMQGTKYNYVCASVYSNLPATNVGETKYTNTIQANRYYKTTLFNLNGKDVYVVETHLDWNQNSNGPAYRASQIQQVIAAFNDKDYVIICGDFNITTYKEEEEMQPFIDAGYTLANGGYLGFLRTERIWSHIDHICAKGFSVSNIKLYEESLDLSDHCLISCDITML